MDGSALPGSQLDKSASIFVTFAEERLKRLGIRLRFGGVFLTRWGGSTRNGKGTGFFEVLRGLRVGLVEGRLGKFQPVHVTVSRFTAVSP